MKKVEGSSFFPLGEGTWFLPRWPCLQVPYEGHSLVFSEKGVGSASLYPVTGERPVGTAGRLAEDFTHRWHSGMDDAPPPNP